MNNPIKPVQWTPRRIERFEIALRWAIERHRDPFVFEGVEYSIHHAKHLLSCLTEY